MWIFDLFEQNACSIAWKKRELPRWTWDEYKENKKNLWDKLILVDMIGYPVLDSKTISDEMFSGKYPEWTTFALYCHSGWSSWYLQMQLSPVMPQYTFVNIAWWIMAFR